MVPTILSRTLVMEVFNQINETPVCTTQTGPVKGWDL